VLFVLSVPSVANLVILDPLERVVEAVERGEPAALATVVRGPRTGTRLAVDAEGRLDGTTGDEGLDAEVSARALEAMSSGRTKRVERDETEVYVEPYAPPPALVVCGAGHIAVPLARMASFAGFRVTVVDDRVEYANRKRFPSADEVLAEDFAEALARIPMTPATAVVLVTRGHRYDWDCLRTVIHSRAGYIGMIGSRRRVRAAMMGLEAEGVPADRLARIAAPIGLDVGAETPEEIAVAILAEIILSRRGGTGRPLSAGS
jgi:xanthine dehydrogenase accessory factor